MSAPELVISPELQQFAGRSFVQAHGHLAGLAAGQVVPPPLEHVVGEDTAGYSILRPQDDVSLKTAVVSLFPIANDVGQNMTIRHRLLQGTLATPMPIIMLPHNTHQAPNVYSLTSKEQAAVASGNLEPIARKQYATLKALGIERMHIIGDSIGSTLGLALMREATLDETIAVADSVLFSPANTVNRSEKQLNADFRGGGLSAFMTAVNQSGIPAYSEIQRTRGIRDYPRLGHMLYGFWKNSRIDTNQALAAASANDHFAFQANLELTQNPDLRLLIVRGADCRMFPSSALNIINGSVHSDNQERMTLQTVDGFGHELPNHLPTFAILSSLAIRGEAALLRS